VFEIVEVGERGLNEEFVDEFGEKEKTGFERVLFAREKIEVLEEGVFKFCIRLCIIKSI